MAQHDYVIANGTGAAVRSDLNNALAAIVSQNSGATAPATTYAYQFWADTTTNLLKLRNSANSAWITLFQLDGEWSTLPVENGTAAAPSIYFKDSGTDTGFYSPGTDQVAISTGGTGRLFINSSGSVGIGTSSVSANLHVQADTTPELLVQAGSSGSDSNRRATLSLLTSGSKLFKIQADASDGSLRILDSSTARLTIDSSGRCGIGTTSPSQLFHLAANNCNLYLQPVSNAEARIQAEGGTAGTGTAITFHNYNGSSNGERARIDSSGRLLVGTSSARTGGLLEVETATTGAARVHEFVNNANGTQGPVLVFYKTRGSSVGSNTVVSSGDEVGVISFGGADGTQRVDAAGIAAYVDGTPGTNDMPGRLVFSTTADGASSPTERFRLSANGSVRVPGFYDFATASAANVNIDTDYIVRRSTSSIKYKKDVETIGESYSEALLQCRPVWYRSKCEGDNPAWGWWGFIAEEVAEIDPRLVHWRTTKSVVDEDGEIKETPLAKPEPEGVQYDRFVPHLLNLIKRQQQAIETLEAKVAALESA